MITGDTADHSWEIEAGVVRPYLLTQGRTHAGDHILALETMVETTWLGRNAADRLPAENRSIIELCCSPQSVAEVAAKLHTPLGVVRVLVTDLADGSLVRVSEGMSDLVADVALLQRLIDKVRAIPV